MRGVCGELVIMALAVTALILCAWSFSAPPVTPTEPLNNTGNECRMEVRGLFIPCDQLDPRRFLQEI